MNRKQKKIIGITGGVGAGKSTVLSVLETSFGARIILADLIAHRLMAPGSKGYQGVADAFGPSVFQADGSLDKAALSALLFHDEAALRTMNAIIHPLVWETIQQLADEAAEDLVVIEAAVFDTAPEGFFDEIWYVYTTEENRILRLMESRGYTRERCESIISHQASEEEYRRRSGRIIDNNGGEAEIKAQIEEILNHEIC